MPSKSKRRWTTVLTTRPDRSLLRIFGGDPEHKVHRLLDFTGKPADVSDPWYSDRFDICYRDVLAGCEALLRHIEGE